MDEREYLRSLGINLIGEYNKDSYVVDIIDSNQWGRVFTKLDSSEDLEQMEDNQVITEQGTSLIYTSKSQPYMLTLISDLDGDVYSLIVTEI